MKVSVPRAKPRRSHREFPLALPEQHQASPLCPAPQRAAPGTGHWTLQEYEDNCIELGTRSQRFHVPVGTFLTYRSICCCQSVPVRAGNADQAGSTAQAGLSWARQRESPHNGFLPSAPQGDNKLKEIFTQMKFYLLNVKVPHLEQIRGLVC